MAPITNEPRRGDLPGFGFGARARAGSPQVTATLLSVCLIETLGHGYCLDSWRAVDRRHLQDHRANRIVHNHIEAARPRFVWVVSVWEMVPALGGSKLRRGDLRVPFTSARRAHEPYRRAKAGDCSATVASRMRVAS